MTESQTPPTVPLQTPVPPTSVPPPPPASTPGRGIALAALIIGVASVLGALIPVVDYVTVLAAGVGIALGVVGVSGAASRRGFALAGLILSSVGLLLSALLAVFYTTVALDAAAQLDDKHRAVQKQHVLVYSIVGDSSDANVSYSTDFGGSNGDVEVNAVALPYSRTFRANLTDKQLAAEYLSLSADAGTTGTRVTCTITLDGKTVATNTSSGEFAMVTCGN